MSKQCWAMSPKYGRCEGIAGHDGDHTIVITWTDDECLAASPFTTTGGRDVPIIDTRAVITVDGGTQTLGKRCYSCGCDEEAHGGDGERCEKHQCTEFVP